MRVHLFRSDGTETLKNLQETFEHWWWLATTFQRSTPTSTNSGYNLYKDAVSKVKQNSTNYDDDALKTSLKQLLKKAYILITPSASTNAASTNAASFKQYI